MPALGRTTARSPGSWLGRGAGAGPGHCTPAEPLRDSGAAALAAEPILGRRHAQGRVDG
jgi:hypothetical protein